MVKPFTIAARVAPALLERAAQIDAAKRKAQIRTDFCLADKVQHMLELISVQHESQQSPGMIAIRLIWLMQGLPTAYLHAMLDELIAACCHAFAGEVTRGYAIFDEQ